MNQDNSRILIVDDQKHIRDPLAEGLRQTGSYECVTAENADRALQELERLEIDLIILDINMPGKSGMDLLPLIRGQYPDVAVVMLSGQDDLSTAVWAMREGAYDYAAKPVTIGELIIRVENALSRRRLVLENRDYQKRLENMEKALKRR